MNTTKNKNDGSGHDVISEASAEHATATDVGAAGGAIAGAVLGAALGPLGAVTGAVLGAGTGVIAGKAIAAGIDPAAEEAHWEKEHPSQPHYASEFSFKDFEPAYRLGWQLFAPGASFEAVEKDLKEQWEIEKGSSGLPWERARDAAKASWTRVEKRYPPG